MNKYICEFRSGTRFAHTHNKQEGLERIYTFVEITYSYEDVNGECLKKIDTAD